MSKRLFSTLLVLSLALTAPFAVAQEKASTDAAKGPHLSLTEPIKDFGTVPKGQKLDWSFVVHNTGTTDLEILDTETGQPVADGAGCGREQPCPLAGCGSRPVGDPDRRRKDPGNDQGRDQSRASLFRRDVRRH